MQLLFDLLYAGVYAILDYIALHVLTCLVPAFLLAGAMMTFISKEAIIKYMGSSAKKIFSFPLAAVSSFFLAVCSCTVIPLSAGIHRRGGGLGPAFIVLWVAPATNLLALVYTGAILGYDMALIRIVGALSTACIIGLVMIALFEKGKPTETTGKNPDPPTQQKTMPSLVSGKDVVLMLLLVATMLAPNYLGVGRPYTHKIAIFLVPMTIMVIYVKLTKSNDEIREWLGETFWFVKRIFPLLIAGVFVVGMIGKVLPEEWIRTWVGGSGLAPTFIASLVGALVYFATLTEAPFVHTLIGMGMGKGPAIALLLNGPGLSLPSIVAIARVYGVTKTITYLVLCVVLATIVGVVVAGVT